LLLYTCEWIDIKKNTPERKRSFVQLRTLPYYFFNLRFAVAVDCPSEIIGIPEIQYAGDDKVGILIRIQGVHIPK
jgi:hypothetical protein